MAEETPDSLDDFESRHDPIEDSHTRAESAHQGIGRTARGFIGTEQTSGCVRNALLGSPDFGQFFRFLLANHLQRNHRGRGSLWRIHHDLSLRSKLARKVVNG